VHCNGAGDDCYAAITAAHSVGQMPILACGDADDSRCIRQAMKAGCSEFLAVDRLREELAEAIRRMEDSGASSERGTAISLFSPSGGIGISTAALNLAVQIANGESEKVALVDLKPAPSDLALMLDLTPEFTVDDLCRDWQRLDRKMMQKAMLAHSSGVSVLAQAGYPAEGGLPEKTLSREAVRQLVTLLCRLYPTAVLDLDHTLNEETIEAMRLSGVVALVARPDVPGLRRARWALDTAVAMGLSRSRVRLVLNRCGGRGQLSVAQAEEMLGIEIVQSIPEDRAVAIRAVNEGVPLTRLARLSRISRSFSSLARSMQS